VREWYGIVLSTSIIVLDIIDRVNEGGGGGGIVAKEPNVMECEQVRRDRVERVNSKQNRIRSEAGR